MTMIISRIKLTLTMVTRRTRMTMMTRMTLVASQADAKRCQTCSRLHTVHSCTFTAEKRSVYSEVLCCGGVQWKSEHPGVAGPSCTLAQVASTSCSLAQVAQLRVETHLSPSIHHPRSWCRLHHRCHCIFNCKNRQSTQVPLVCI